MDMGSSFALNNPVMVSYSVFCNGFIWWKPGKDPITCVWDFGVFISTWTSKLQFSVRVLWSRVFRISPFNLLKLLLLKLGSTFVIQQRPSFEMIKYKRQPLILTPMCPERPQAPFSMSNVKFNDTTFKKPTQHKHDIQSSVPVDHFVKGISQICRKSFYFQHISYPQYYKTGSLFNSYRAHSKFQSEQH